MEATLRRYLRKLKLWLHIERPVMEPTKLMKEYLDNLSRATNRATAQTIFLWDLCDGDIHKLLNLEERIRNNHISYCPGDREEIEKIMALPNEPSEFCRKHFARSKLLTLDEFRIEERRTHNTCICMRNEDGTSWGTHAVPPTDGNRTDYLYEIRDEHGENPKFRYAYNVPDGPDDPPHKGLKIRIENGKKVLPFIIFKNGN